MCYMFGPNNLTNILARFLSFSFIHLILFPFIGYKNKMFFWSEWDKSTIEWVSEFFVLFMCMCDRHMSRKGNWHISCSNGSFISPTFDYVHIWPNNNEI